MCPTLRLPRSQTSSHRARPFSVQYGDTARHNETTEHLFGIGIPEPVSRFFVKRSVFSDSPRNGRVPEAVERLLMISSRPKGFERHPFAEFVALRAPVVRRGHIVPFVSLPHTGKCGQGTEMYHEIVVHHLPFLLHRILTSNPTRKRNESNARSSKLSREESIWDDGQVRRRGGMKSGGTR